MKNVDYNRYDRNRPSVLIFDSFLNDIDQIAHERDYWKSEAEEWRNKYQLLLSESANHMNEITGQVLSAFLHKDHNSNILLDEVSK
jgi:hypothetical protein